MSTTQLDSVLIKKTSASKIALMKSKKIQRSVSMYARTLMVENSNTNDEGTIAEKISRNYQSQ
jgi:hypothetical protein